MGENWSRRSWLKILVAAPMVRLGGFAGGERKLAAEPDDLARPEPVPDAFPAQPPELVREMVFVSHFDWKRVKELVDLRPTLANAAWDWGFGDWESALGAASHMGNRPIAEFLISKGARPSLFSAAMLGQLDVVKAFIAAQPGVQRIRGPHSIPLLAHAKAGGDPSRSVFQFLELLGDAGADAAVPLSEAEMNALKGTYVFGIAASQQIEISVERENLTWTRKGMMGRPLTYLGERTFHAAGSISSRIRFAEQGGTMVMTVSDADFRVVARRR
jgi:hypothetical protein